MPRSIAVTAVSAGLLLTLSGCMFQFASGSGSWPPGTPFISGTVTGTPITGSYTAVITGGGPSTDQCSNLSLLVTLTDAAGNTVTKEETGLWCTTGGAGAQFTGQYTVTGGTGIYQGATGSGTSTIQFNLTTRFGPIMFTSQEIGSFQVPGTASAASKRRFKTRGTVSAPKLCNSAGRNVGISKLPRACKKLGVSTLGQTAGLTTGP